MRRAFLSTLALSAALSAAACGRAEAPAAESGPRLEMKEAFHLAVPDSFALAGAVVSPGGVVAAWAGDRPYLLYDLAGKRSRLGEGVLRRPLAAAFAREDVVEVVDAGRGSVVRMDAEGRLLSESPLRLPFAVEDAARADDGWYLGGRDGRRAYRVARWTPGGVAPVHQIVPARGDTLGIAAHLARGRGGVILTRLQAPFEVSRFRAGGEPEGAFRPVLGTLFGEKLSAESGGADRWVSLGALPLDRGFIQTLADLNSDLRILVLYDGDGGVVRHTVMDVPMGFIASDPERRLLLAARRTDALEVVGYRWSWSEAS